MSTRKRKLSESNISELIADSSSPKKIKLSHDHNNNDSISSIFLNSADHQEFVSYFNMIEKSQLTKTCKIPMAINREIAEFATGIIKQCANNQCKAGICILNQEMVNFKNGKETKWNYCSIQSIYFCSICKPSTVKFTCCDRIQYVIDDNKHKCPGDDDHSNMCYDDDEDIYYMRYKCLFCDINQENDDRACPECGEWCCYYHRPMLQCFEMEHNLCCYSVMPCKQCNESHCEGCGLIGGRVCDNCSYSWCMDCIHQFEYDSLLCKECGIWYCQQCVQEEEKINLGKNCEKCQQFICNINCCIAQHLKNPLCK